MPETFGKRKRGDVKAKKALVRDERRVARARRREAREAGLIERGPELGEPFDPMRPTDVLPPRRRERRPDPAEGPPPPEGPSQPAQSS